MKVNYFIFFFYVKIKEVINISIFDGTTAIINLSRPVGSYVVVSETVKLTNGRAQLREVPDKAAGITFTNGGTTFPNCDFTIGQLPIAGVISVDFDQGMIYCDPTQEGLTITCSYQGKGAIYLSSSRIFSAVDNSGNITQTLKDVTANATNLIDVGNYNSVTTYNVNNLVHYQGAVFICILSSLNNIPASTTYFRKISGYKTTSTYNITVSYAYGDVVNDSTNQVIYQSVADSNLGNSLTNTSFWTPMISVATLVSNLNAAEAIRVSSENTRISQENTRVSSENIRISSENTRLSSESSRVSVESSRVTAESGRTSRDTAYQLIEAYNAAHSYIPLNKVVYNSSTYQNILASTGVVPTNTTNWILIAQAGSVTSVISSTTDISIATGTTTPVLTANTGISANQLAKRDANGNLNNIGNQVIAISANTTLTVLQVGIIEVTTGASNITVTLPSAVTAQLRYTIKKVDSGLGQVIIATTSSQSIDGVLTSTLYAQYANSTLVSNGTGYDIIAQNDNGVTTSANLTHGLNALTTQQASMANPTVYGRTLVNLLGKDGNCESLTPFSVSQGTVALDANNKTNGNNGFLLTIGATFANMSLYYNLSNRLDTSRYWLILSDVKNGNATNITTRFYNGTTNVGLQAYVGTTFTTKYVKLAPSSFSTSQFIYFDINGVAGQYGYVDGIRLYEISAADYALIDVDPNWTGDKLANRFPYVDDVKHAYGTYINRIGENMLPPFNEWTLHANAVVTDPYGLTLNATAGSQNSVVSVPVVAGQTYTFSGSTNTPVGYCYLEFHDISDVFISGVNLGSSGTAPTNAKTAKVFFSGNAVGTFTFTNPQLELGTTATAFEARNDDYMYGISDSTGAALKLASNVDGSVRDELIWRDGSWRKLKRWMTDVVLDGSLAWAFHTDSVGFKQIKVISIGTAADVAKVVSKYDGKILSAGLITASDQVYYEVGNSTQNNLYLSVADIDTGFGETYTPTAAEISAYFWGYRLNNGTFGTPYNGTGTKTWTTLEATSNVGAVTVVPTTQAVLTTYTSYKLSYQLAVSVEEVVTVEGSIGLHSGGNTISISEGIITREKVTPYLLGSTYYINTQNSSAYLKNRASQIISVYKETTKDQGWTISTTGTVNGLGITTLPSSSYSSTDNYYVTYQLQDKHTMTANVTDVSIEYQTSPKSITDSIIKRLADDETNISVSTNQIISILVRLKAAGIA